MKFLCGSCRTKYQISDDKVRGKILTIRCKKCGAKILVRESLAREASTNTALAPVAESPLSGGANASARAGGSVALAATYETRNEGSDTNDVDDMPTSIAPIPSNAGLAGYEWYVAIDGQQHGPFAFAELVGKVQRQEILGRHYVWHDGMEDWTRVRAMPDLIPHLAAQEPKSIPPPPPQVDPSPAGDVLAFKAPHEPSMGGQTEAEAAAHQEPVVSASGAGFEDGGKLDSESKKSAAHVEMGGSAAVALGATFSEGTNSGLRFGLTGDDIFANVPRASEEELVRRESTKFFVAAAGVPDVAKKNRIGTVVGLLLLLTAVTFAGLWVGGIVHISLPGLGNPFAGARETTAVVQNTSELDDDGNYALLVEGIRTQPVREKKRARKRKRRTLRSKNQDVLSDLDDQQYVDDRANRRLNRTNSESLNSSPTVSISGPGTKIRAPESLTRFDGPNADLSVPPPDVQALDAATIERVVAGKKASVRICYERSIKAREKLQGKLQLLLVVQPDGRVARTQIVSPAFKGSVVGRCIQSSIRNWRFPRFSGSAQEIELPFVFQRGG